MLDCFQCCCTIQGPEVVVGTAAAAVNTACYSDAVLSTYSPPNCDGLAQVHEHYDGDPAGECRVTSGCWNGVR